MLSKVHEAIQAIEPDSILTHFDGSVLLDSEDERLTRLFARADCPMVLLEYFSQSKAEKTLKAVATSPAQCDQTQSLLMSHERSRVRQALASNPVLSPQVMLYLFADPEKDVRKSLAENPSVSAEMLVRFFENDYSSVEESAIAHPNFPQQKLMEIMEDDSHGQEWKFRMRRGIANNPNAPAEVLSLLMRGEYEKAFDIKSRAVMHPNTPAQDVLSFLVTLGRVNNQFWAREASEMNDLIKRIFVEKRLDILLAAKENKLDMSQALSDGTPLHLGILEAGYEYLNNQIMSMRLEEKANKLIAHAENENEQRLGQSRRL